MVFELQFLDWLQTLQTPILNEIMKAVTHLGDAGALWIILAAVLLAFPKTIHQWLAGQTFSCKGR